MSRPVFLKRKKPSILPKSEPASRFWLGQAKAQAQCAGNSEEEGLDRTSSSENSVLQMQKTEKVATLKPNPVDLAIQPV
jgi:hypothetical protein